MFRITAGLKPQAECSIIIPDGANPMKSKDLYGYFEKQRQSFTELLEKMVSFPSQSGSRENINLFADFLVNLFSEFNPRTRRLPTPAGDIVQFTLFPGYRNFLVLLAHMDTITVNKKSIPLKKDKNHLYGTGCYDMKNGIALFYFVLKAIHHFNLEIKKKIKLILTPDEETGSSVSMPFLLKECQRARAVLLPEPSCPDGGVKIQRKGVARITASLYGKASHSGIDPEKGSDANRALVQLIVLIEKMLQQHHDMSFNPGIISGGHQVNQVSGESRLRGEIRSYSNRQLLRAAKELKSIRHLDGVRVHVETELVHPALEPNPRNQALVNLARDVAGTLGSKLSSCSSGGCSDGSNLSAAGIPVLDGLGMRGAGAHSEGERVELSDFPFRAALLSLLCQET